MPERRYIELAAAPRCGGFTRNGNRLLVKTPYVIAAWRHLHGNTDVYQGVFEREAPRLSAPLIAPFFVELDRDAKNDSDWVAQLEPVRDAAVRIVEFYLDDLDIPEESIAISFSGGKGFHVLMPPAVLGVEPHHELNAHYRSMAFEVARRLGVTAYLDKGVYDARRVLRLINSINAKGSDRAGHDVYKIPLSIKDLITRDIGDILELAARPRRRQLDLAAAVPVPRAVEFYRAAVAAVDAEKATRREQVAARAPEVLQSCGPMPPCIHYLLQQGAPEGHRNSALFALAAHLHQRQGLTVEEIVERVGGFAGLESEEIEATVRSAGRGHYGVGCLAETSRLRQLVDDGVTVCDRDLCPILEGF